MTFIMRTSVCVAFATTSVSFMGQAEINYSHQVIRPLLQMLYDHNGLFLLLSAFAGFIAFDANLGIALRQKKDQEQRYKKYMLENQSNTKSRLELTKLQERGY